MSQSPPKIVIYLKTFCGWSEGVRSVMRKYNLAYEEKDVIKNPAFRWEMEQLSGQPLCPCVEVDGHMLADVSGEEVEKWLIQNEYVAKPGGGGGPDASGGPLRAAEAVGKDSESGKIRSRAKTVRSGFFD